MCTETTKDCVSFQRSEPLNGAKGRRIFTQGTVCSDAIVIASIERKCVVTNAIIVEPVSIQKFTANKEKKTELIWPNGNRFHRTEKLAFYNRENGGTKFLEDTGLSRGPSG